MSANAVFPRLPLCLRLGRIVLALALGACATAGPDYRRPGVALPATLTPAADALDPAAEPPAPAERSNEAAVAAAPLRLPARWWEIYGSGALNALVERSLAEHPSVLAGQAALREADAFVRAQQGLFAPQVQAGFQATRQRTAPALASPLANSDYVFNLHTLQLDLGYTPDVFGANRRAVEGLQAGAEAQQAALEATRLALAGNVALAAIQEAGLRAQRDSLVSVRALQGDLMRRTARLAEAGQASEADLASQEAAVAALDAQLPPLDRALGQTRDLLKALVGVQPDEVLAERFELAGLQLPEGLPEVLPAQLLDRRPDIRLAEAQLKAASAAIGVAAAARLPQITLGVNAYGTAGNRLSDLLRASNAFWNLAGGLTQPLFDGGTLQARDEAAREAYLQAEQQYRLTVVNAFQNVADALLALHTDVAAVATARRAEAAARRSYEIGRRQLEAGDLSTFTLAQLQQSWIQARSQRIAAEAGRLSDSVALFQALAGSGR